MPDPDAPHPPDLEALRRAADVAARRAETRELLAYAAAEQALAAQAQLRRVFGSKGVLDGHGIGARAAHAPQLFTQCGAAMGGAAQAKRRHEQALLAAARARRALARVWRG